LRQLVVPQVVSRLATVTAVIAGVVLILGTIVTGSGPHSGDATQPARTGFDPRSVAWLHADVVMLFVGLVVATLVAVWLTTSSDRTRDRAKATWRGVLVVTLLQGAIGYAQYFTGLPEVLVGLHMLGASLLVVTMTLGLMNLRHQPL
jgi:cytochrome c oxidase assembly protein subunit 15